VMERASQIAIAFLANALWQITLLVLAMNWCERLARRRSLSAKSRHLLWVVALILSVALPLLSLQYFSESGRLYFASNGDTTDALPAPVSRILHFVSQRPGPIFMSEQFARPPIWI